jgi:hypothetical protein
MRRLFITAIILSFGASATLAQNISTPSTSYCLQADDATYMKVDLIKDGTNLRLYAFMTMLDKFKKKPETWTQEAKYVTTKNRYDYFQTPLDGNDDVRQTTYAVRDDKFLIFVSDARIDADMDVNDSQISTYT